MQETQEWTDDYRTRTLQQADKAALPGAELEADQAKKQHRHRLPFAAWLTSGIISNTGTVSLQPDGFSLVSCGVQFIPSMSRTRKATHRTRFRNGF